MSSTSPTLNPSISPTPTPASNNIELPLPETYGLSPFNPYGPNSLSWNDQMVNSARIGLQGGLIALSFLLTYKSAKKLFKRRWRVKAGKRVSVSEVRDDLAMEESLLKAEGKMTDEEMGNSADKSKKNMGESSRRSSLETPTTAENPSPSLSREISHDDQTFWAWRYTTHVISFFRNIGLHSFLFIMSLLILFKAFVSFTYGVLLGADCNFRATGTLFPAIIVQQAAWIIFSAAIFGNIHQRYSEITQYQEKDSSIPTETIEMKNMATSEGLTEHAKQQNASVREETIPQRNTFFHGIIKSVRLGQSHEWGTYTMTRTNTRTFDPSDDHPMSPDAPSSSASSGSTTLRQQRFLRIEISILTAVLCALVLTHVVISFLHLGMQVSFTDGTGLCRAQMTQLIRWPYLIEFLEWCVLTAWWIYSSHRVSKRSSSLTSTTHEASGTILLSFSSRIISLLTQLFQPSSKTSTHPNGHLILPYTLLSFSVLSSTVYMFIYKSPDLYTYTAHVPFDDGFLLDWTDMGHVWAVYMLVKRMR